MEIITRQFQSSVFVMLNLFQHLASEIPKQVRNDAFGTDAPLYDVKTTYATVEGRALPVAVGNGAEGRNPGRVVTQSRG